MAENSGGSEPLGLQRRGFLRGPEHETGVAYGNGQQSLLVPLGHFALIIVALFIVSNAANQAGQSQAVAQSAVDQAKVAIAAAQDARMESRLYQSKVESLRNEVSELRGMMQVRPKEK